MACINMCGCGEVSSTKTAKLEFDSSAFRIEANTDSGGKRAIAIKESHLATVRAILAKQEQLNFAIQLAIYFPR